METFFDNFVNDPVVTCRKKKASYQHRFLSQFSRTAELRQLTPIGDNGFRPLDLGSPEGKAPNVCGLQLGRNVSRHEVDVFWSS